jgi:dihydrofolate reductase
MAISPNGLIARDNGDEDWLPEEGWTEFVEEAKQFNNIVMGRETYEVVTRLYKDHNFDSVDIDHKVIVTTNKDFKPPDGYMVVHSPEEAIDYISSKNIESLFLIGGGKLNAEFLKRKLVNEIELTINPYVIGKGRPFIFPTEFDVPLELLEYKELSKGRIFIKYRCINNINS